MQGCGQFLFLENNRLVKSIIYGILLCFINNATSIAQSKSKNIPHDSLTYYMDEFIIKEKDYLNLIKVKAREQENPYKENYKTLEAYYLLRNNLVDEAKQVYQTINKETLLPFLLLFYQSFPTKLFINNGEMDQALAYEYSLLNQSQKAKDTTAILHHMVYISKIYLDFKQYEQSEKMANEAMQIRPKDKYQHYFRTLAINNIIPSYGMRESYDTVQYYLSMLEAGGRHLGNNNFIANAAIFNANILNDKGLYTEALAQVKKAIEVRGNTMFKYFYFADRLLQAEILIKLNKNDEALKMLQDISHEKEFSLIQNIKLETFRLKYEVFRHLSHNDSALFYYKEYAQLKEKIMSENVLKTKDNLEIKYKTKEQQNLILSQQKKLLEEKSGKQLIIAGTVIAILLGSTVFLLFTLRNNKKWNNKLLAEQLNSTKKIVFAEEKQKQDISMNLHDNLGQILTAVKLKLTLVNEEKLDTTTSKSINTAVKLLDTSINEMRNISRILSPIGVEKVGLRFALHQMLDYIPNETISKEIKIDDIDPHLANVDKIHIYRITQELINNTLKYSQASILSLKLTRGDNGVIEYSFQDNGIGMDPDALNNGMGIENVTNRLKLIGATYQINTAYHQGFQLQFLLFAK